MNESNDRGIFEKHTPIYPLPEDILKMSKDETICQFCGVSYLIHNEIKSSVNSKLNILTDTGDPIHYEKVVDKRHFKQNEVQQTKRSTFLLILRLLN